MPVNCASWSITTTQSSASAGNVPCWVCPDPRSITDPHRCVSRPCGSWRGSMLSTWRIPAAVAAGWWTTWPEMGSRSAVIHWGPSFSSRTATTKGRIPSLRRSRALSKESVSRSCRPARSGSGTRRPSPGSGFMLSRLFAGGDASLLLAHHQLVPVSVRIEKALTQARSSSRRFRAVPPLRQPLTQKRL